MKTISKKGTLIAAALITLFSVCGCKKNSSPSYSGGPTSNGGYQITMSNYRFNPSNVTVAKGTVVTWINNDYITHTVTSNNGAFDSGDIPAGKSYTYTFTTTGTFSYYCRYHVSMGMTGTIVSQ